MGRRLLATVVVLTALVAGRAAHAGIQGSLEAAVELYTAAAYDDALVMLEHLAAVPLDPTARVSVDHYRMLCLLALGRNDEADRVVASLLTVHPTYTLNADDTSPRVMQVFLEARRRALPGVVRQRYEQARKLYAARDYAGAATEFAIVRTLLTDGGLTAAEPQLADLGQLAAGFEDLSREALAAAEAKTVAAAAPKARDDGPVNAERDAATAAPLPPPPMPETAAPLDGIYGVDDPGVVPPVPIRQDIRRWSGPTPPPVPGTPLGKVQYVIDETGAVVDAYIVVSVSGFYDRFLLESVMTWRYQPASKDGRPVKFRRVVALLSR